MNSATKTLSTFFGRDSDSGKPWTLFVGSSALDLTSTRQVLHCHFSRGLPLGSACAKPVIITIGDQGGGWQAAFSVSRVSTTNERRTPPVPLLRIRHSWRMQSPTHFSTMMSGPLPSPGFVEQGIDALSETPEDNHRPRPSTSDTPLPDPARGSCVGPLGQPHFEQCFHPAGLTTLSRSQDQPSSCAARDHRHRVTTSREIPCMSYSVRIHQGYSDRGWRYRSSLPCQSVQEDRRFMTFGVEYFCQALYEPGGLSHWTSSRTVGRRGHTK
jgi:hypothetical protein